MIAQVRGPDVGAKTLFTLPGRTLLISLMAMLVGAAGTVAVHRALDRTAAPARTAAVQYLPPVNRGPVPASDFSLHDQSGQLVTLSTLRGRTVLLTFMDPRCTTLCPLMGQQISSIEASLPSTTRPVLLVVSVAAERTAADVNNFVSHVSWQPGWHWLLGTQAELQAVWATWSIGVVAGADIQHNESLFVVDPRGRVVATYNAPLRIAEVTSMIAKYSTTR